MTTRRRFLTLFSTAALLAFGCLTANSLMAAKGGNGGGGGKPGGEDPPPVIYALQRFTLPADYLGNGWSVHEMNDVGELVGNYPDGFVENSYQPFYFDVNSGNTVATNLNDVVFDENYGVPAGWYITRAQGINNLGDIAGGLALYGDPEQICGCVIEMRPDPLDSSVKPRIHMIPDGVWSRTYARRINDVGVVLGRGNPETAYVYRIPLHGQAGDASVTTISTPFDAFYEGYLTNPINGGPTLVKVGLRPLGNPVLEILTYNVDTGISSFADISTLGIDDTRGFNDLGSFCGRYTIAKGKNKGRYGYVFDGVIHSLDDMKYSNFINNSGDVVGPSQDYRPILNHPAHGSIMLDDVVIAESVQEQSIWDNSGSQNSSTLSERNENGFPVISGSMRRPDSSFSSFYDGYVLVPITP